MTCKKLDLNNFGNTKRYENIGLCQICTNFSKFLAGMTYALHMRVCSKTFYSSQSLLRLAVGEKFLSRTSYYTIQQCQCQKQRGGKYLRHTRKEFRKIVFVLVLITALIFLMLFFWLISELISGSDETGSLMLDLHIEDTNLVTLLLMFSFWLFQSNIRIMKLAH